MHLKLCILTQSEFFLLAWAKHLQTWLWGITKTQDVFSSIK